MGAIVVAVVLILVLGNAVDAAEAGTDFSYMWALIPLGLLAAALLRMGGVPWSRWKH